MVSRRVLAHALPLALARRLNVASELTVNTRASIAGFVRLPFSPYTRTTDPGSTS